jgi:hypothetical protein
MTKQKEQNLQKKKKKKKKRRGFLLVIAFSFSPTPFHCIALHLYHMTMFSSVASTSALAAAPDFVLSSFLLLLLLQ